MVFDHGKCGYLGFCIVDGLIPVHPGTYHRVPWQVHVNSQAELAAVVGVDRSCYY
jgi:hypothetical protein